MKYHQCRMKEVNGSRETIGWIEDRGAKVGAHVELKDFDAFFEVLSVSDIAINADDLRQKQANDRNCFASIA